MDYGVLVTALVGIVTTLVGSWGSWFFARKKYNSEVDKNLIENMKESLEFYKHLSDDNKKRLDEAINRCNYLEKEMREMRAEMFSMMSMVCMSLSCGNRKPYNQLQEKKEEKK